MGIDIDLIFEYKDENNEWKSKDIEQLVDEDSYYCIISRDKTFYALLGYKIMHFAEPVPKLPKLPIVKDLSLRENKDTAILCSHYEKYTDESLISVMSNIIEYDASEEFHYYFCKHSCRNPGIIYIEDAISFDYDQECINGRSWRDMLTKQYFTIIDTCVKHDISRFIFSFD